MLKPPSAALAARWAATLALGAAGGALAWAVGLPLPWLIGALGATGGAAAAGLRLAGGPPAFPVALRLVFVPVIGVLIGGAVTPAVLAGAVGWLPGLLAVGPFVALSHGAAYLFLRRVGGLSKPTAWFAAMPGGLIEAIELGEKNGADVRALAALQFARIALVVTLMPLAFAAMTGGAVGSAAGARLAASAPLTPADALILIACGVVGFFVARRLRLPAGQILGPILASGAAHAAGLTAAAPPDALVALAQLVIGVSLGVRFTGFAPRDLGRLMLLALGSVSAMLAVGAMFAAGLAALGLAPFAVMMLALAPGGVVEMGLIAVSLRADPIFVTALHLARIVATVTFGVGVWRRIAASETGKPGR